VNNPLKELCVVCFESYTRNTLRGLCKFLSGVGSRLQSATSATDI
jgi:hypothetical protein